MDRSSSGFHVREATVDDYAHFGTVFDEAETFHREALPQIFQKPAQRFPSPELYTMLIQESSSTVLVAEEPHELVGFVVARTEHAPDDQLLIPRRFAMVDMLAVRRNRQHRGIGQALMAGIHGWAQNQGLHEINLNVWEFNRRAISFYEELGYTTISRLMTLAI